MPRQTRTQQAAWAIAFLAVACCGRPDIAALASAPDASPPIRNVRVLIASKADRVRIRADAGLSVRTPDGETHPHAPTEDWMVIEGGAKGTLRLGSRAVSTDAILLIPEPSSGAIALSIPKDGAWSAGYRYPGHLIVQRTDDGAINVVNAVGIEPYLAGVVASEAWPTFDREAYRGQAIISRSFVLFQMKRRKHHDFDLSATQAAQVYRGLRTDAPGRRAAEAVRHTRGIVCCYDDNGTYRILNTYYSSACGGESQSAAIFGAGDAIQPLAGGVRCDYCKIAPGNTYRWGPVRLDVADVQAKLTTRYPKLAMLGRLTDVTPTERTPSGRPVRLRLTGDRGTTHEMLAEHFRLAIGGMIVRSTHCAIRIAGDEILFEDGRGFGHGLGLCQWGMQGQALAGKKAGEILRYYYPGCRLMRAY